MRVIFGLSLLPHTLLRRVFLSYKRTLRTPSEKLKSLINYIDTNYIRSNSLFPPTMWAGLQGKATNNGAEAFHRVFGDLFGYIICKPGIWHFLRNMNRFNIIKNVKMKSVKMTICVADTAEHTVGMYLRRQLTVTQLMQKLSAQNFLKCHLRKKSKI